MKAKKRGRKAKDDAADRLTIARTVSPDDLKPGQFIAVMREAHEVPSFLWCGIDPSIMPLSETVRIERIPDDAGLPLKVKAICLPFIFATSPQGDALTLDVRLVSIARLTKAYAKKVRKALKARRKATKDGGGSE